MEHPARHKTRTPVGAACLTVMPPLMYTIVPSKSQEENWIFLKIFCAAARLAAATCWMQARGQGQGARVFSGHWSLLSGSPPPVTASPLHPFILAFHDTDLLFCQAVEFVDKLVNLAVGGADEALEGFLVAGVLGGMELFVEVEHGLD